MSIEIRREQGRDCPIVICDHCGKPITDARNGNCEWPVGGGPVSFTHKACCHAFDETHGGRKNWGYFELSYFSLYLDTNLHVDRKKQRERVLLSERCWRAIMGGDA